MEAPEARLRLKTSKGRMGAGFENLSTATSMWCLAFEGNSLRSVFCVVLDGTRDSTVNGNLVGKSVKSKLSKR